MNAFIDIRYEDNFKVGLCMDIERNNHGIEVYTKEYVPPFGNFVT